MRGVRRLGVRVSGFTLLELLVVLAIVAIGSAGVGFAMRDGTQSQLEREALRLSAWFEAARARSQLTGTPVRWQPNSNGFRFEGLSMQANPPHDVPTPWLDADTRATVETVTPANTANSPALLLGPDPIIAPQSVTLSSRSQPDKTLRLATDGVRPFAVQVLP